MKRRLALLLCLSLTATPFAAESAPEAEALANNRERLQALDARLHDLQELLSQLELQAEQTKASLDKTRPQPISLGSGQLLLQQAFYGPSFETASGAQLLLGFNLDPLPSVHGSAELEFIGAVAPDRTLPQQELVQLVAQKRNVVLKRTEIRFENDQVLARAFRMVPRPDFSEEGDLFYLFPAADDPAKAWRQSGRPVPSGAELALRDGWFKGLDLWVGDELIYGITQPTGFARYRSKLGRVDFALMGLWVQDPQRNSGHEVVHDQEAWLRLPIFSTSFSLDLAALRRATRVGQSYEVSTRVAPGTGYLGSDYGTESVKTTEADAWGAILRLRGLNPLPGVDEIALTAKYAAPLAGNVTAFNGLLSLRPQRYTLLSLEGLWQKPIIGPAPDVVIVGTPLLGFGQVPGTGPRPFGSLITVSQDPISGFNNREMTSASVTLEFNPGRGWFYKWRPRIVEAWNFNTDLETPFSAALSGHAYTQPTGTDLSSYINADGIRVAEPANASGLWPSQGWLYNVSAIAAFRAWQTQWWLVGGYGDQVAGLSPNIIPAYFSYASRYISGDLNVRWRTWLVSLGYAENIYGPDDWYRSWGDLIGAATHALLAYHAGASKITVEYNAWRDREGSGKRFVGASVPSDPPIPVTAPLDQLMVSYALNF